MNLLYIHHYLPVWSYIDILILYRIHNTTAHLSIHYRIITGYRSCSPREPVKTMNILTMVHQNPTRPPSTIASIRHPPLRDHHLVTPSPVACMKVVNDEFPWDEPQEAPGLQQVESGHQKNCQNAHHQIQSRPRVYKDKWYDRRGGVRESIRETI